MTNYGICAILVPPLGKEGIKMASKRRKAKEQLDKATRVSLLTLVKPGATAEDADKTLGAFLDACDAADEAGVSSEEQDAVVAVAGGAFDKFVAAVQKAKR